VKLDFNGVIFLLARAPSVFVPTMVTPAGTVFPLVFSAPDDLSGSGGGDVMVQPLEPRLPQQRAMLKDNVRDLCKEWCVNGNTPRGDIAENRAANTISEAERPCGSRTAGQGCFKQHDPVIRSVHRYRAFKPPQVWLSTVMTPSSRTYVSTDSCH
jgi:hypothetical protein